jgi:hypothetical protein
MTYFSDLTPYSYGPPRFLTKGTVLNVGWLDSGRAYNIGKVDLSLVEKLLRLCAVPVNRMRGWHACPFCEADPVVVAFEDQSLYLGDAEIRITGKDGIRFASPTLIYHYIRDHEYKPPDVFMEALQNI